MSSIYRLVYDSKDVELVLYAGDLRQGQISCKEYPITKKEEVYIYYRDLINYIGIELGLPILEGQLNMIIQGVEIR